MLGLDTVQYNNVRFLLFDLQSRKKMFNELNNLITNDSDRELLENYRIRQKETLFKAIRNHPYFSNFSFNSIESAPVTDKKIILDNFNNWYTGNQKDFRVNHTSGSTGKPFKYVESPGAGIIKRAARLRMLNRYNIEYYSRELKIGGITEEISSIKDTLWQYVRNRFTLSSLMVDDNYCKKIVLYLDKYKPKILVGYSTTLNYFEKYYRNNNIYSYKPEYIINTAEYISEKEIVLLKNTFDCRVINHYCATEGHLGHTCLNGKMHLDNDICDITIKNGEVLYTNLFNTTYPIVNYKLGDKFYISGEICGCGSLFPVLESFSGRTAEVYITKTGKKISQGDVNMLIAQYATSLLRYRLLFRNTYSNNIIVEYVSNDGAKLDSLVLQIKKLFEVDDVTVRRVFHIPNEKSGKFKFFKFINE